MMEKINSEEPEKKNKTGSPTSSKDELKQIKKDPRNSLAPKMISRLNQKNIQQKQILELIKGGPHTMKSMKKHAIGTL